MKKSDRNIKLKPAIPGQRFRIVNGFDSITSEKKRDTQILFIFGVSSNRYSSLRRILDTVFLISSPITKLEIEIDSLEIGIDSKIKYLGKYFKNLKKYIKKTYNNLISQFKRLFNYIELIGTKIAKKRNSILMIFGLLSPISYIYLSEKITFFFLPLIVAIITGLREKSTILLPLLFATSIFLEFTSYGSIESFKYLREIVYITGSSIIIYNIRKLLKTKLIIPLQIHFTHTRLV